MKETTQAEVTPLGYKTPCTRCPCCAKELNRALPSDGVFDGPPQEGEVTVCIWCASVLFFLADGRLRKASDAEIEVLARRMPEMIEIVEAFKRAAALRAGESEGR